MPNGIVHHQYYMKGYWLEIPISLIGAIYDFPLALGNILGYTFHRYSDNDWDLMGTSASEGRAVNEIPVLGHFLFGISSMYGSIFRRHHRSFITHFPGISTAIRLAFVFTLPMYVLAYYGVNLSGEFLMKVYLGFWLGLSQADSIHFLLDTFYGD